MFDLPFILLFGTIASLVGIGLWVKLRYVTMGKYYSFIYDFVHDLKHVTGWFRYILDVVVWAWTSWAIFG